MTLDIFMACLPFCEAVARGWHSAMLAGSCQGETLGALRAPGTGNLLEKAAMLWQQTLTGRHGAQMPRGENVLDNSWTI